MTATAIIKSCPSITPNPYYPHFFLMYGQKVTPSLASFIARLVWWQVKCQSRWSPGSRGSLPRGVCVCVWGDPFFTLPRRGMGIAEWNQAFWATLFFLWVDKTEGQKCIRQFAATKGQATLQSMRHLQRESHNLTRSDPWLHIPRILSHGILPLWNHCSQAVPLLAATYSLGLKKKKMTAQ